MDLMFKKKCDAIETLKGLNYDIILEGDEYIYLMCFSNKGDYKKSLDDLSKYHTIHLKYPNQYNISMFYICMLAHNHPSKTFKIETRNKFSDYPNIIIKHTNDKI
jgi:hypothetical protein